MQRNAFKMRLKLGMAAELKAAGVADYSIFLDKETHPDHAPVATPLREVFHLD